MADIRIADPSSDRAAVSELFLGFLNFLYQRSPEEREVISRKYDPAKIDTHVDTFFQLHARPHGALLLAHHEGRPVGIGMMREMAPDIAEIQRVFVSPDARGLGVGKALTQALIDLARADGKRLLRLDTGKPLTEARALYEGFGFRQCDPYHDETPYLNHLLVYYEMAL